MNFSYIPIGKGYGGEKPPGKSPGYSREKMMQKKLALKKASAVRWLRRTKNNALQKTNARIDRSRRALKKSKARQSDAK